MEKLNGKSKDILKENIEKLKQIFPDIVTEGNIDFDKLKTTLGDYVDDSEERYNFTWNGKSKAKRLAQTPSTGTLRPCKDESINWDITQNLFIEGDNLEVLKLLQKTYHKRIKMIYIDPPYNTGNDFVYKDDFRDNIKNYLELTGQVDGGGRKLSTNAESSGRYHTDWINMMYPRLKLARNLLRDDGVMFISIDDGEQENLRKMCNEIFGEENFLAQITRKTKLTSNKGNFFAPSHEYILVYARSINSTGQFNDPEAQESEGYLNLFKYEDDYSKYNIVGLYQPSLDSRPNQRYYIKCPDGTFVIPPGESLPNRIEDGSYVKPKGNHDKVWRWSYESYLAYDKNNLVFKKTKTSPLIDPEGKQASWNVYTKIYLKDRLEGGMRPVTTIQKYPNSEASKELIKLKIPFDFSKPKSLIMYLCKIMGFSGNDIVLDFFSGSATTAHAAMQLNVEDGGSRKFIMVQLPELCDEKSEAFKEGYKTIADIGKERIRRVIKKIETEKKEIKKKDKETLFNENEQSARKPLDLGFKVLKLDSSNIKTWDSDFDSLEKNLLDSVENIKKERSTEDVLYEILLKYGLDLTLPIEKMKICKKTVYSIGLGALIVCLDKDISLDVVEGIAKLKEELNPEVSRVVFSDAGFKDDVVKTNTVQILKQHGIEDVKSI